MVVIEIVFRLGVKLGTSAYERSIRHLQAPSVQFRDGLQHLRKTLDKLNPST